MFSDSSVASNMTEEGTRLSQRQEADPGSLPPFRQRSNSAYGDLYIVGPRRLLTEEAARKNPVFSYLFSQVRPLRTAPFSSPLSLPTPFTGSSKRLHDSWCAY